MSGPTISFVVHHVTGVRLAAVFATLPTSARRPAEVLLVGRPAHRPWWHRLPGVGSTVATSVRDGVDRARGELVWFVDARATVHREAWARTLRRIEEDPTVVHARASLTTADGEVRSARGLLATDLVVGAPVFAVVRRAAVAGDPAVRWPALVATAPGRVERSHPVALPVSRGRGSLPTTATLAHRVAAARGVTSSAARGEFGSAARGEFGSAARGEFGSAARGEFGSAARGEFGSAARGDGSRARPTVGWIGFHGHANLGDEAVLAAARTLLPAVDVVPGGEGTHGTVLGGGTLLNTKRFYQRVADDLDAPGLERLVLGTGVVSPALRGFTEELDPWRPFLEAGPVGLRGPDSVAHLRAWGWEGPVEVLGDPALALGEDHPGVPGDGVVLAPVGASSVGQVEDEDARLQLELLVAATSRWQAQGRSVSLLLAHPGDAEVRRRLAERGTALEVVEGWHDLDRSLAVLAGAGVVVGTRLHAIVLAAAVGTPFVGLAYRPKLLDFARSVDAGGSVASIGAWDPDGLVTAADDASLPTSRDRVAAAVAELRGRLRTRTEWFGEQVASLDR